MKHTIIMTELTLLDGADGKLKEMGEQRMKENKETHLFPIIITIIMFLIIIKLMILVFQ